MQYTEWNLSLFNFFFTTHNGNKLILLDIDVQDLKDLYEDFNGGVDSDQNEVLSSFITAIKSGPLIFDKSRKTELKSSSITSKITDVINLHYHKEKQKSYGNHRLVGNDHTPPIIAYAVAFILAAKNSSEKKYYQSLLLFFKLKAESLGKEDQVRIAIDCIWSHLENDPTLKGGDLGFFFNKKDSPGNRRYVDKILSHFIIPRIELIRLPQLFWKLELTKDDAGKKNIVQVIRSRENELKRLTPQLLSMLKSTNGDELLAEEILNKVLLSFDGITLSEEENIEGLAVKNHICRLKLAFIEDSGSGLVDFFYFFQSAIHADPIHELGGNDIEFNSNNWSSKICRNDNKPFFEPFVLANKTMGFKATFNSIQRKLFLFINGMSQGLSYRVNIEVSHVEHTGIQYLLFPKEMFFELSSWIEGNNGKEISENLKYKDWLLYEFDGISFDGPFEPLHFQTNKKVYITGGLKGKGQYAYVVGFPFQIKLDGAIGNELLEIEGYPLIRYNVPTQSFIIDQVLNVGSYILNIISPKAGTSDSFKFATVQIVDVSEFSSSMANLSAQSIDQFGAEADFQRYRNLVNNNINSADYPPQFEIWTEQEIDSFADPYSVLAQTFISYLAYRGEMGKQLFDENFKAFYEKITLLDEVNSSKQFTGFSKFKNSTLRMLKESCRVDIEYGQNHSVKKIVPIAPFMCLQINASSLNLGLNSMSAKTFMGDLYFLGGCWRIEDIQLILKEALSDKFREFVTVKVISEFGLTALNIPAVYIYIRRACRFVEHLTGLFNFMRIFNYHELYPLLPSIVDFIKNTFDNPGLHSSFHDQKRCLFFNRSNLKFKALQDAALESISLTLYPINEYQKVCIIRENERSAEVDLYWGRYIYLSLIGHDKGYLFYDPVTNTLAIRSELSLPWPAGKILFLSTGRLPMAMKMSHCDGLLKPALNGDTFAVYQGLFFKVAEKIFNQLGLIITKENYTTIITKAYD